MASENSEALTAAEDPTLPMLSGNAGRSACIDHNQFLCDPAGLAQEWSALLFGEQTVDVGHEHSGDGSVSYRQSKSVSPNYRRIGRARPNDSKCRFTLIERDSPAGQVSGERAGPGADLNKGGWRH